MVQYRLPGGFQAEGYELGPEADPALQARQDPYGAVFETDGKNSARKMTALTDTRFLGLYYDIPAFDEPVHQGSIRDTTKVLALFIAQWCGLNLGGD